MRRKLEIALVGLLLAAICFSLGFYFGRNSTQAVQVSLDRQPVTAQVVTDAAATEASARSLPATDDAASKTETASPYPVHINSATKEQLMTLPGIGETKAQRILDYRAVNGLFQSAEDLLNIEGIGQKTLEGLLDYITLE